MVNRLDLTRRDAGLSYEIEVNFRALLGGTSDEINLSHNTNPISGEFGDYISSGRFNVSTRLYAVEVSAQPTMPYEFSFYASFPSSPDTLALSKRRQWSKTTNGALFLMAEESNEAILIPGIYSPPRNYAFDSLLINQDGTFEIIDNNYVAEPDDSTERARTSSVQGTFRDTADTLYLMPSLELACNGYGIMQTVPPGSDLIDYTLSLDLSRVPALPIITDESDWDLEYVRSSIAAMTASGNECYPNSSVIFSGGDLEVIDSLGPDSAEQEPNNEAIAATPLSYQSAVTGSIGPGDAIDFFTFTPHYSGRYNIYAEFPTDAEVWIQAEDGAKYIFDSQVTNGIERNLTKDTDYVFSFFWRPENTLFSICFVNSEFDASDSRCTDGPDDTINYRLYFEFLH